MTAQGTAGPDRAEARRLLGRGSGNRYTATAQALHWLTALLMLAILPIAWHMTMLARTDPARETWYTVHKSIGLTILALAVVRLAWRAAHPAPPLPGVASRVEHGLASASHWLLYALLLLMPISGYLLSAGGGHPVSYFGLFTIPVVVPQSDALAAAGRTVHDTAQWALYGFLALHVLATVWHLAVRHDGVLDRMLPEQVDQAR